MATKNTPKTPPPAQQATLMDPNEPGATAPNPPQAGATGDPPADGQFQPLQEPNDPPNPLPIKTAVPAKRTEDERMASIAVETQFTPAQVAIVKSVIAKNVSDTELAFFLFVCKNSGLNPFNKEVWCFKNNQNQLLIFAGRDGYLARAQRDPRFNGIRSGCVRENDQFEFDAAKGVVKHVLGKGTKAERGKMLGAWCKVFMVNPQTGKKMEETLVWCDATTFTKSSPTWNSYPDEMMCKCAESHALKKAIGLSGIQVDEDYYVRDGIATPIGPTVVEPNQEQEELTELRQRIIAALDMYQGEDCDEIKRQCGRKIAAGEFTKEYAMNVLKEIGERVDEAEEVTADVK